MEEVLRPTPNLRELSAIILVGLGHVGLEFFVSEKVAGIFSIIAVIGFLIYIVSRVRRDKGILALWGFRISNLKESLRPYLTFLLIGLIFLTSLGLILGNLEVGLGFLISLLLYPLWGIAQQFVLQNFVANNVRQFFKSKFLFVFIVSLFFSLSHYPRILLAGFVFLAGVFLTFIYEKYPNIWLAGIVHGVLATAVFYWVFDLDLLTLLLK